MVLEIVMRALVVYESMFGSTRRIAEAVAAGLDKSGQAVVVGVADAHEGLLTGIDLLVVGGPTQGWSMSRPSTRRGAPLHVAKPESGLTLEPGADTGPGVREWLAQRGQLALPAAAFDTRVNSRFLVHRPGIEGHRAPNGAPRHDPDRPSRELPRRCEESSSAW
jgi:hypothetical protein